jgi:site-specific DNA-methyltransferase (adenine-specific)
MKAGKREPSIEAKFAAKRRAWAEQPAILRSTHRIYEGDGRSMEHLGVEPLLHLVVTSPPYWNLKEYPERLGSQLGNMPDYQEFLSELSRVWRRCFQLLVPGGRLCVVVGDVCLSRRQAGRHSVVPLHADISRRCIELGFDYLSPIFWYKIANASTEVEGNGSPFLGKPYEPNAIIKSDVEYILIFRKPGAYRTPSAEQRTLSIIEREDHERWFRQVWTDVPGQVRLQGHPAPYPKELAFRLVSMFSFVGDVVLDPFWGTGTTTAAAVEAHRCSIGYEVEPRYLDIGKTRFSQRTIDADIQFVMRDGRICEPEAPYSHARSRVRVLGARR